MMKYEINLLIRFSNWCKAWFVMLQDATERRIFAY